jgi:hypothetical protein
MHNVTRDGFSKPIFFSQPTSMNNKIATSDERRTFFSRVDHYAQWNADLTPHEFRCYAHYVALCEWGGAVAWWRENIADENPFSKTVMARVLKMDERTVVKCRRSLIEKNLIRAERKYRDAKPSESRFYLEISIVDNTDKNIEFCTKNRGQTRPPAGVKSTPLTPEIRGEINTPAGVKSTPLKPENRGEINTSTEEVNNNKKQIAHSRDVSPPDFLAEKSIDPLDHIFDRQTRSHEQKTESVIASWNCSHDVRDLCTTFARLTEITPAASNKTRWMREAKTLIANGVTSDEMSAAWQRLKHTALTIASPGGLFATIQHLRAKHTRDEIEAMTKLSRDEPHRDDGKRLSAEQCERIRLSARAAAT